MSDTQPLASPASVPAVKLRRWRNMSCPVERLAFMQSFGCVFVIDLKVLLAIAEAGGEITFEDLRWRAGECYHVNLRRILDRLGDPKGNAQGSVVLSDDGQTITLTDDGRFACQQWNLPLGPVCPKLGTPGDEKEVKEDDCD